MSRMTNTTKPGFFPVVADPQSYINILYLLLSYPLGIIYFVFLVTGLSLGFGMIVLIVGIPMLLLVLGGSWVLCEFERRMTIALLKEEIPKSSEQPASDNWWDRFKAFMGDRVTWTGILYLLLKFPIGIASFTIAVTLVSLTLGLLFAPAYSWTSDPVIWGSWEFNPFPWSWFGPLLGIPLVFISLHLMNVTAFASGRFARVMLGKL